MKYKDIFVNFIPEEYLNDYKRNQINRQNTIEAYDIAFNALCEIRVMIEKKNESEEINQYIEKTQEKLWQIGLKNITNRNKKCLQTKKN